MDKYELLDLLDLKITEVSKEVDELLEKWSVELRPLIREKIGFFAGLVEARKIIDNIEKGPTNW